MNAVYGEHCVSVATVKQWSKWFPGHVHVKDDDWPGQVHYAIVPEATTWVDAILKENLRVTIDGIAETVYINHGSVHTIL
jgi:hypothetical protein